MTPARALEVLKEIVNDSPYIDAHQQGREAVRTLEDYRNPDAEALAACVAELINLENALNGTAMKIGRLLTRFSDYAGRASVTPPRILPR